MTVVGEETAVEAYFGPAGEIVPRGFTCRGCMLKVEGVGRCWQEGEERCFAILAAGERPFELRLDGQTLRWRVVHSPARGWPA